MPFSSINLVIATSPEEALPARYWNDDAEVLNFRFEDFDFRILDSPVQTPEHKPIENGSQLFLPNQRSCNLNRLDGLDVAGNHFMSYPSEPFIESMDCFIPRIGDETIKKRTYHDTTRPENESSWEKEVRLNKKTKVDQQMHYEDPHQPLVSNEEQKDIGRAYVREDSKDEGKNIHLCKGRINRIDQFKPLGSDHFKSIIRRAAVAIHRQWPADAQAYKQFQTQIDERFENLKLVSQKYLPCKSSDVIKIEGLPIILESLKQSPKDESCHDTFIRLSHHSEDKWGRIRKKAQIQYKIQKIGEALNSLHNLVGLNGLDFKIIGKHEHMHQDLLDWFEGLIFKNTEAQFPLLGLVQLNPSSNISKASFNCAQIYLASALTDLTSINRKKAIQIAFELIRYWYQEKSSTSNNYHLSDEEYWQLISHAVMPYFTSPMK
ncbi:hypothetical protein PGT21_024284 [Puccinia graminis f. sp. tritici]|uniref:Uncharacterized protein n=1 Tax=Puccinia graminis f. sp. tritici TaxID=56615 RepID=A0A5B0QBL8_PUCGR|nr:hypothetical protein PGT21_024284 [Puccinia graminis f. sp. tritici]